MREVAAKVRRGAALSKRPVERPSWINTLAGKLNEPVGPAPAAVSGLPADQRGASKISPGRPRAASGDLGPPIHLGKSPLLRVLSR